jgi:hypothetical protein
MQAAGINEYILNNVAEALGSIPEEQRRGIAYTKAMRRFAEQDQVLQQQMAQRGMYRWGGGWVDEKRLDELKAAEKEIRGKLEALQTEYNAAGTRLQSISAEIASNENTMAGLRINAAMRDAQGNLIMIGPPQAYYDIQRQNQTLVTEQDALRTKMLALNEQAKRLNLEMPVPRFTGIQQLVGVEGMPGAEPPATQSSSSIP